MVGKKTEKRKLMLFTLASALALAPVAGCGNNNEASPSKAAETASNGSAPQESQQAAGADGDKFDPPVTITTVRSIPSDVKFKNGETVEDNVHTRWTKDKFGINLKYLWTVSGPNETFETKLRLSLSSGEKFPDIVTFRGNETLINDLIDSGKFQDAGALFDKYASDTWKAAMNEDPTVWYAYTRDKKRIGIPILDYAQNGDPVMWIREDWLKKLNLKAPTTIAELEQVLDAFTNRDPDGNNKKDTYGLAVGLKNAYMTWMADAGWVFGAFGAMPNQWNKMPDGTLAHGSVQPETKEGLRTLASWMSKGYLSEEAALTDEVKAAELFTSGKAGIIVGPHWMPSWPLEDVKANVPGAEYKAYPIPTGPDGKAGRHGTLSYNGVILINKDMEHPEAFFKYQNYLFDHFANPEVGGEFENGMYEGYDYATVDGKIVRDDTIPGGKVNPEKYTLTFDGARIPSLMLGALAKLADGAAPATPFEKNLAEATPKTILEAAKIVEDQKDITMPQMFTGPLTKTMTSKNELLKKLEAEAFNRILYGQDSIDSFDKFVQKWKEAGGDAITTEVNEWYKSVSGK